MKSSKKGKIEKADMPEFKTFEQIDSKIDELTVQKSLMLKENLGSDDAVDVMKAINYLDRNKASKGDGMKAYLYAPENYMNSGNGFQRGLVSLTVQAI